VSKQLEVTVTDRREYLFPLRPGVDVTIRNVPVDLTVEEANRIERFLLTLIVESDNDHQRPRPPVRPVRQP